MAFEKTSRIEGLGRDQRRALGRTGRQRLGPAAIQQLADQFGCHRIAGRLWVRAAVLRPSQLAVGDAVGHLAREMHRRHIVMPQHGLVRLDRRRRVAGLNLLEHRRVDEMRHHQVAKWLPLPHLPDDPLHPQDAAASRVPRVLVVVHRKLDKQQVDSPLGQYMVAQPERPCLRVGRGDTGIDKLKLGFGESRPQPVADHRTVAVHLRD